MPSTITPPTTVRLLNEHVAQVAPRAPMTVRLDSDVLADRIRRARPREIERIAAAIGAPEGKIRGYGRAGTLSLAPWAVRAIADTASSRAIANANAVTRTPSTPERTWPRDAPEPPGEQPPHRNGPQPREGSDSQHVRVFEI